MSDELTLNGPRDVEHAAVWLAEAIDWAYRRGATDLHLFPSEHEAHLWVRLDGELREVCDYANAVHKRMISRLKVLGRCTDYAGELIQEGRFTLNGDAASGEARLSIVPTLRGDKAVIRLLGGSRMVRQLDELGFDAGLLEALRLTMDQPQGMLIAIGPSGCGKSTALYALLRDLHERTGHPLS
ncbi:ATPase, T2SS/T4P/T4SS family, partial [Candidatus Sumerlaeota bacterium]